MAVVLASLLAPATALAQTSQFEPPDYRRTIEQALEEYQLGNYQEARDQFARAHALFPSARTLRGLGLTAFELRNYVEAVGYLESALISQVKPMSGALRAETEQMLMRGRSYVGELALHVQPASALLLVDGVTKERTSEVLRLDIGDHVLEFRAEGFMPERRAVRVQGGKRATLQVVLARLAAQTDGAKSSPEQRSPARDHGQPTPVYKRWWLWTTIGVVVAGAATAVVLLSTAEKRTEYRSVPGAGTPDGVSITALRSRP